MIHSIFRSRVIEYIREQNDTTVTYHYCDFMDRTSTSPAIILRSLLARLLPRNGDWMKDEVFADLVARKYYWEPPSVLLDLCKWIGSISRYHKRVTVLVDALDECNENQGELLTHLRDLAQINGISIFLTSRKEHDIEVIFQGLPSIPLTDFKVKQTTDMKAYIDDQLHSRPSLSMLPPRLREEIRGSLVEKADGV